MDSRAFAFFRGYLTFGELMYMRMGCYIVEGAKGSKPQEETQRRGMLQLGLLAAGHLPIFFAIFFTLMLSASYVLAVWHGDIDPVFPYISYSGDHRPESCIFSMMLNLCSFLIMLIIYLRYSLVVELNRDSDHLLKRLNIFAFVIGMVGGVGMFVVANFQETAVITVHLTGAFLCFGCGCFYMLLQFCLTIYMYPLYNNRRIGFIRGAIALSATLFFVTVISFGVAASIEFHKHFPDLPTPRPWSRKINQPGYNLHCISAIAEWCLAVCNVLFILSFSRDFEKLRVELNVQPLVSHLDNSPLWRSATDLSSPC
ncbi:DNA damage-regulated autophagy modulator protein [Dirofilaria immitis]|nr:DNA damage-regulated autophagy modulator protein 1 [Dirofilaria immitis]